MVGLLHGLFYKPSYSFSLFPSRETVCMARVCCSLICFSTPLRTVDCFVQYNPVLWPTTTPLRPPPYSCFRAPISLPALESGGSGPRLPCPQAPAAAPLQPPDMTNDSRCRYQGCWAWETGSWPSPSILGSYRGFWAA